MENLKLVEIIEKSGNYGKKVRLSDGGVYYSVPEAARLWQTAKMTAYRWYENGRVKGVVEVDGSLYVPEKTVEELKLENRVIRIS